MKNKKNNNSNLKSQFVIEKLWSEFNFWKKLRYEVIIKFIDFNCAITFEYATVFSGSYSRRQNTAYYKNKHGVKKNIEAMSF